MGVKAISKWTNTYESKIVSNNYITKSLNIDKIKNLDDVKRVLKFLNITVTVSDSVSVNGYDEVKDLFDY